MGLQSFDISEKLFRIDETMCRFAAKRSKRALDKLRSILALGIFANKANDRRAEELDLLFESEISHVCTIAKHRTATKS